MVNKVHMIKNNKGFSFVEVLAVLIILAVILALTVPKAVSVIDESRKGVVKTNASNYLSTLQLETKERLEEEDIKEDKYIVKSEGKYLSDGKEFTIHAKGELPTEGIVCIDKKGTVGSYSLAINGYVVNNVNGTEEIVKGDTPLNITCDVTKEIVEIKIPEDMGVCTKTKTIEIIYPKLYSIVNEYRINNGDWKEYTNPIELKENATIYARLRDTRNNEVSDTANIVITKIDNEKVKTTSPVAELSAEHPTNQIEAISRQTDNCEIDTSTIEYGISDTKNGEYKYYKENIFTGLKNNTTYYVKTRANDIANNGVVESEVTEKTTGEFVEITITPSSTDWKPSKTVTITITGSTPGATLEYMIKNGSTTKVDWTKYTGAITINWDSNIDTPTYIYARLNDGVNTSEPTTYTETHVDTQAPGIATSVLRYDSSTGTVKSNSTAWTNRTIWWGSFNATDAGGSGINHYEYSTGCTGSKSDNLGAAYIYDITLDYAFCIRAIDNAGNIGGWSSPYYIRVDKTAPSTPTTMSYVYGDWSTYGGGWTNQSVYAVQSNGSGPTGSTDAHSGVAKYQISSDGSNWYDYSYNSSSSMYAMHSDGVHTRYFRAVDAVGNASSAKSVSAYIDKTVPTVSYSYGGGTYTTHLTVTVTGSDTNFSYLNVHVYKLNSAGTAYDFQSGKSVTGYTTSNVFNVDLDSDGVWIVYAQVYDKAGNRQISDWDWYQQNYVIAQDPYINYTAYLAGGQVANGAQGSIAGTVGLSKQLEQLEIAVNVQGISGGISYQAHVQDQKDIGYGEGNVAPVSNGSRIGTKDKRMEKIRIWLTGDLANYFDVYYRVHLQNYGWLDTVKGDTWTGSSGLCLRMEAIEIVLVRKNSGTPDLGAPGSIISSGVTVATTGSVCSTSSQSSGSSSSCNTVTCSYKYSCKKTITNVLYTTCANTYHGNCTYSTGNGSCTCEYTSTCTKTYTQCNSC